LERLINQQYLKQARAGFRYFIIERAGFFHFCVKFEAAVQEVKQLGTHN
jgi:hypothetical protein